MTTALIISFFIGLFSSQFVKAQTVLIPDSTVTSEAYFKKCQLDGYICVQNFQIQTLQKKATPQFDAFIDSIDLGNKTFLTGMTKQIQQILKQEPISIEQVNMFIRLLEQAETVQSQLLVNELKFVLGALKSERKFTLTKEPFIIFFKTPLSLANFTKMKKSVLELPFYAIDFNQEPSLQKTTDKTNSPTEYFVTGQCDAAKPSADFEGSKWQIMSEQSCGWSKSFSDSSKTVYKKLDQNKHWILTGALVIGAAILASQYDVQLQY